MINEAWQQLPVDVRNDVETIIKELNKLDEATLQPAQIQSIFQSLIATRGKGGDNLQVAKKVKAQLTPLFAKITGNEKLNGLLAKVGNAVPIEGIKKMVASLPEPAGSKATQIVSQINAGAKQIQDDQDLAAFKGYEHHRPVTQSLRTNEYWYETLSDSARLSRNLRLMLGHIDVEARVTFRGRTFQIDKLTKRKQR